jgi:hypothetical protein
VWHSDSLGILVFNSQIIFVEVFKTICLKRLLGLVTSWYQVSVFVVGRLKTSDSTKGTARLIVIKTEWALLTLLFFLLNLLWLLIMYGLFLNSLRNFWNLLGHLIIFLRRVHLLQEMHREVAFLVKRHQTLVRFLGNLRLAARKAWQTGVLFDWAVGYFTGNLHLGFATLENYWLTAEHFWG